MILRHRVSIDYLLGSVADYNTSSPVLARNMVVQIDHPTCGPIKLVNTPIKYSDAEPCIRSPPPTLGQHTDEILRKELGLSEEDMRALRNVGVIA